LAADAASATFRAISEAADPCSSTAAAIEVAPDLLSGTGGLRRQCLHLAGHHGKPLAGIARARRLDGRIECQQVRLRGNLADHVGDRFNASHLLVQRLHGLPRLGGGLDRAGDHGGGVAHLRSNFANRPGQLFGGTRHGLRVDQYLLRGGRRVSRRATGAGR
jgi:hypothetical protein